MRTAVKIIIYANTEDDKAYDFEDGIQARIESTFENDSNMEVEEIEFDYPES